MLQIVARVIAAVVTLAVGGFLALLAFSVYALSGYDTGHYAVGALIVAVVAAIATLVVAGWILFHSRSE
jgi:hypothetical protein